jgi:NADH-quinone oxidoreductase subunit F
MSEIITAEPEEIVVADQIDLSEVDGMLDKTGRGPEAVIPILQAIQTRWRYLPTDALQYVCKHSEITPATIEGVATFYSQFRRDPVGKHVVSLCDGTACHVKGSEDVLEAMTDELGIKKGEDTDPDRTYTIQKVACIGCCSLAPAMQIDGVTYAHAGPDSVPSILNDFQKRQRESAENRKRKTREIKVNGAEVRIGIDSCCVAGGTDRIQAAVEQALLELDSKVPVKNVSCIQMCHQVPVIEVVEDGKETAMYVKVDESDVPDIMARHFKPKSPFRKLTSSVVRWTEHLYGDYDTEDVLERHDSEIREEHVSSFFNGQVHIATEHHGEMDPASLDEYLQRGGFMAVEKLLYGKPAGRALLAKHQGGKFASPTGDGEWAPQQIIDEIKNSGLRGRGGAGFPTGLKWKFAAGATGSPKYILCNADEGDPGAFMDRSILESDPHAVIEGMIIGAKAIGAHQGYVYVRAEYPLAIERLERAIAQAKEYGLLGEDILGSGFDMDIDSTTAPAPSSAARRRR